MILGCQLTTPSVIGRCDRIELHVGESQVNTCIKYCNADSRTDTITQQQFPPYRYFTF